MKTYLYIALISLGALISCGKKSVEPNSTTTDNTNTNNNGGSGSTTSQSGFKFDDTYKSTGNFATLTLLQSDGKLIIGNLTQIARLNVDGSLDNTFAVGSTTSGEFHGMQLQADGKVLICGTFKNYNSQSKSYLLRLNMDGTVDNTLSQITMTAQYGKDNDIRAIAIQTDSKLLIGGYFDLVISSNTSVSPKSNIARLNNTGVYDASLNINTAAEINRVRLSGDSHIFLTGKNASRLFVAKFNTDGSISSDFNFIDAAKFTMSRAINDITTYGKDLVLQSDGKIIVCGRFDNSGGTLAGTNYSGIVRLNANGTIDTSLPQIGTNSIVTSISLNATRLIFSQMQDQDKTNSTATGAIIILNSDASIDKNLQITGYKCLGDGYNILQKNNGDLILAGKTYDHFDGYDSKNYPIVNYKGIVQLLKL